ncbi:MAG TPA: ATP-binding protein [Streptosporangiaceae bacterium]
MTPHAGTATPPEARATEDVRTQGPAISSGGRIMAVVMVPGKPELVPVLRALVGSLLADHPAVDDIRLMATETIGNAIRHTRSGQDGGMLILTVLDRGRVKRVEVIDEGCTAGDPHPRNNTQASEDGYGLQLVAALAAKWETAPWGEGSQTWFEI